MNPKIKSFKLVNNSILLLVFFTVPLFPKLNTAVVILWCISSFFLFKKNQLHNLRKRKEILLFLMFYVILILGVFYSLDVQKGLSKLGTQVSIILFPIFLGTRSDFDKNYREDILYSFSAGSILAGVICIINALYRFLITKETYIIDAFSRRQNLFFYKPFSQILDVHPSYLSICMSVVSLFILNQLFFKKKIRNKKTHVFIFLFLTSINFMLASKAGILSFLLTLLGYLFWVLKKSQKKRELQVIVLITFSLVSFFCFNSSLNNRFKQALSSTEDIVLNDKKINDPVGIRYELWKTSLYALKENVFLGTGTGSVKKTLNKECVKHNFFSDCEKMRGMNAHNQFLDILVSHGLVGFVLFLMMLFFLFRTAIKKKDVIFLIFLIIIVVNMFFESLLQREKGIILFMSFISFFISNAYTFNKITKE